MTERKEKDYRVQGFLVALALHAIMLFLFYFMYLRVPDPPISDSSLGGGGTELTLGDPAGEINVSELLASNSPAPTPQAEPTPEPEPEPTEEITAPEHEDEESEPIEVPKEKPKTQHKIDKPQPEKKKVPEPEVKPDPQPTVDANWTMGSKKKNNSGATANRWGDPNGNTEMPNQKGRGDGTGGGEGGGKGTGKGVGLGEGLSGWKLMGDPYPPDNSQESGSITFKVYVDNKGRVERVETLFNRGIKPSVVKLYQDRVYSLSFEPPAGKNIPARTTGTVNYDINAK